MPAPKKTAAKKPTRVDTADVRPGDAVAVISFDGTEYELDAETLYRLRKAIDRALVEVR